MLEKTGEHARQRKKVFFFIFSYFVLFFFANESSAEFESFVISVILSRVLFQGFFFPSPAWPVVNATIVSEGLLSGDSNLFKGREEGEENNVAFKYILFCQLCDSN